MLARLGADDGAVRSGVEYGRLTGVDEVATPTGRVVLDGDRVVAVYVHAPALERSLAPDDLLDELGGPGERLPGSASKGSKLHVYPDEGLAFAHDGPKLQYVEAFPPTTLEGYRETLLRERPQFRL